MNRIEIIKYNNCKKIQWDQFISGSKNGNFLFLRYYMEYHSDRFADFSLMFYENGKLIAVMPANISLNTIISHQGLTYGGIISDNNMRTSKMIEIFDELKIYLKNNGIKKMIYKTIPHIYHLKPAEEDLYALFFNNAKICRRDVSVAINMNDMMPFSSNTQYQINKSKRFDLKVKRSYDFKTYMTIVHELLKKRYNTNPTHTAEEIELLATRFPTNIKLYAVYKDNEMISGTILYQSKNVAHSQYSANSDMGKKLNAMYLLFDYLINKYYSKINYFDFGISTEEKGRYLNKNLINFKERFGARAVMYDFYELDIP